MDVLIVDGYNIIGAWEELQRLKSKDLGQARDRLIEIMADYQGLTSVEVIIVFDAYFIAGKESKQDKYNLNIIYTKEDETADECIERLISVHKNVANQVYVATSDYMEQRITFGRGALRKSARELIVEIDDINREIAEDVKLHKVKKPLSKITLNKDILEAFERIRRDK